MGHVRMKLAAATAAAAALGVGGVAIAGGGGEPFEGTLTGYEEVPAVSTGATGNTPVGTWRVYREVFGWDWILYHPMYFLRGFAIHGYPEVPMWPASHGCVRVPLWIAASLRERWGHGSIVRVYA